MIWLYKENEEGRFLTCNRIVGLNKEELIELKKTIHLREAWKKAGFDIRDFDSSLINLDIKELMRLWKKLMGVKYIDTVKTPTFQVVREALANNISGNIDDRRISGLRTGYVSNVELYPYCDPDNNRLEFEFLADEVLPHIAFESTSTFSLELLEERAKIAASAGWATEETRMVYNDLRNAKKNTHILSLAKHQL